MVDKNLVDQLMQEAMTEESITCPECGEILEVNEKKCSGCDWENLLVTEGLIPGAKQDE